MEWRRYFDEVILERGYKYYGKGKVSDYCDDGEEITAIVSGSEVYSVSVGYDGGKLKSVFCNCPHAKSGNYCKHVAAVLFYKESGEPETAKKRTAPKTGDGTKHKADKSPRDRLVICEPTGVAVKSLSELKSEVRKLVAGYKRRGFIEYFGAYECAIKLSDLADRRGYELSKFGAYETVVKYATFTAGYFSGQNMDDDGGIGMVLDVCESVISSVLDKSEKVVRFVFDHFISLLPESDDIFYDWLHDFVFSSRFGKEFAKEKVAVLDEELIKVKKDDWYKRNHLLSLKAETMAEGNYSEREVEAFIERNIDMAGVQKLNVKRLLERGKTNEAISFLKEQRRKGTRGGLSDSDCTESLIRIYETIGDKTNLQKESLSLMTKYGRFNDENFGKYKMLFSDEEWDKGVEVLISGIGNEYDLAKIYSQEGMRDRLATLVLQSANKVFLRDYMDDLSPDYDEKTVKMYIGFLEKDMIYARDRKYYKNVARELRTLTKYTGGREAVRDLVAKWRSEYPKRSALIEEIDKIIL